MVTIFDAATGNQLTIPIGGYLALTFASSILLKANVAKSFSITATGNFQISISGGNIGDVVSLYVTQDSVGSRVISFDSTVNAGSNNGTLSGSNKLDVLKFEKVTSSLWLWTNSFRNYAITSTPTLPDITNLLAQYNMLQGSNPITLYDLSGNNNNGTLGNVGSYLPSYTSVGVNFDGSIRVITLPTAIASSVKTVIIACDFAPSTQARCILSTDGGTGGTSNIDINTDGLPFVGTGTAYNIQPTQSKRGPNVLGVNFDGATTSNNRIFWNGTEVESYNVQQASAYQPASSRFWVGDNGYGSSGYNYPYKGNIYYMLLYSAELSLSEHAQASAYIASQVSSRGVSFGDTLASNSNNVLCLGDSITFGYPNAIFEIPAKDWISVLRANLVNDLNLINLGISGQTLQTILSNISSIYNPLWANYSGKKVAILFAGTNDIAENGRTASQVISDMSSACSALLNGGANYVIVVTMITIRTTNLSGVTASQFTTAAQAANTGFRALASSSIIIADVGGSSYFQDGSNLGDGTHPTDTGYGYISTIIRSALATISII